MKIKNIISEDLPPPENARKTQIAGTLPTYKKAADMLAKTGVKGKALDFGAGLGLGTGELGPDADSYEPYPGEKFKPHFVDVTKIPDNAYHKIVNLNVLNVVPNAGDQRIRDAIVKNIGRVLAPGGVAIITTRGKDVLTIKGTPGEEPMSMISKIGTYQKGFSQTELKQYVAGVLGDGFDVSSVRLGPAGVMIKKHSQEDVDEANEFNRMIGKISSPESLNAKEAVDMIDELIYTAGASYKEALQQASISFEIEPKELNALYKQRESRDAFDGMFGGGNPASNLGIRKESEIEEGETWSKHNNPRAGGMSKKSVSSYRRSHPGSKIQTAVTTKPSKLKKGSKAAKRRKSFCARMRGMKKSRTSAKTARDPNSNINKSLRRWNCESVEQMHELVMLAEQFIAKHKK